MKIKIKTARFAVVVLGCLLFLGWTTAMMSPGSGEEQKDVETLLTELRSKDVVTRRIAATKLGRTGDARAIKPLIDALNDKDRYVQNNSVSALVEIGESAVEPLIEAMENKKDVSFRCKIAGILGKACDTRAVEPLIKMLKKKGTKSAAAEALGDIGDTRANEPLIDVLNDKDAGVWESAATALGKIGDDGVVESVIDKLKGKKEKDRWKLAVILGKLNDTKAVEPLITMATESTDSKTQECAIFSLLDLKDPRATEIYIAALNSDNSEIRLKAARNLVNSEDPGAIAVEAQILRIIEEETYLLVNTFFNKMRQPVNIYLWNAEGEQVAMKSFQYSGNKPTRMTLYEMPSGKVIKSWNYDKSGRGMISPMYLCLDENGNIIRDEEGNPVFVKTFTAYQRSVSSINYRKNKYLEIKKIYRCKNCAEVSGIENCGFIW
jgi:HEAT repeat protein